MNIIQLNSKTIILKKKGIEFLVQYYYLWNGVKKEPESVILRDNAVSAFFLTSLIKDRIEETEHGFSIIRSWNIVPEGEVGLSFCLDTVVSRTVPFLFPCLLAGEKLPQESFAFAGERLAHPASLYFFPGNNGIFISTDIPVHPGQYAALNLSRSRMDRYHCQRTEILLPPRERFPGIFQNRKGFIANEEGNFFQSGGDLKQDLVLNVLIDKNRDIYSTVINFTHHKLKNSPRQTDQPAGRELISDIKLQIKHCLDKLAVIQKGIYGVKDYEESNTLSISSTLGLSLLIQMLYRSGKEKHETSLQLADFCLKAQHPAGVFFNEYYYKKRMWFKKGISRKLLKQDYMPAPMSLVKTAEIANLLLLLSEQLKHKSFFYNAYFQAAAKAVDFFFREKTKLALAGTGVNLQNLKTENESLLCLELLPPLLTIYRFTGLNRYKQAVKSIKNTLFPGDHPVHLLPAANDKSLPDFNTALLLLKSVNVFEEVGLAVRDKQGIINNILPWIYYNRNSSCHGLDFSGGILDSFQCCCIISRGFELAYHLLQFRAKCEEPELKQTIANLAEDLIGFSSRQQPGISIVAHTLWAPPADMSRDHQLAAFYSTTFTTESRYLLYIAEQYPEFL